MKPQSTLANQILSRLALQGQTKEDIKLIYRAVNMHEAYVRLARAIVEGRDRSDRSAVVHMAQLLISEENQAIGVNTQRRL